MTGDRPLSLKEVADRAGVAVSSVSRVLTNHPDVSEGMRGRVMAVVEELGYEPNLLASSLKRRGSRHDGRIRRPRHLQRPLLGDRARCGNPSARPRVHDVADEIRRESQIWTSPTSTCSGDGASTGCCCRSPMKPMWERSKRWRGCGSLCPDRPRGRRRARRQRGAVRPRWRHESRRRAAD